MTRISSWIGRHPTASLVIFMFAALALGNAGQEITRINIRFALMTSEMARHPLGVFPTLNGQPYADYPSLYFEKDVTTVLKGGFTHNGNTSVFF